jgi:hypothetical protein
MMVIPAKSKKFPVSREYPGMWLWRELTMAPLPDNRTDLDLRRRECALP